MIYKGLNRTGEIETVKAHGGADVVEVYGGIGESNPIYYKTRTITGQTPLSYKALSKPLSDYLIAGNTVQDGTPTPEVPVDVVGCGERTENLFDKNNTSLKFTNTSLGNVGMWSYSPSASGWVYRIPCKPSTTYTISYSGNINITIWRIAEVSTNSVPNQGGNVETSATFANTVPSSKSTTFTTTADAKFILFQSNSSIYEELIDVLMLNEGSNALPYEPYGSYGFKLPLTINGTEYPIYLWQVPTRRRIKKLVLTGDETWTKTEDSNSGYFRSIIGEYGSIVTRMSISTHFQNEPITSSTVNIGFNVTNSPSLNASAVVIRPDNVISMSLGDFKSYLAAQYTDGTPITVWYVLGNPETSSVNEPLMRIGDYADTISMAQAGVTIPTVAGANTLTIDTTVQPSAVSITGNIKEVSR